MGNEFQQLLDHDNLEVARNNLNEFTGKINKKRYIRGIEEVDEQNINEAQLGFINENTELSFEEIRLLKRFCDYMKRVK